MRSLISPLPSVINAWLNGQLVLRLFSHFLHKGLRIPKGQKEAVQAFAQERGESVNALIWGLLQDAMGVDKTAEGNDDL